MTTSDVVTYPKMGEWVEKSYPEAVVRVWSGGNIELNIDAMDMPDETRRISDDDLPGDWCIKNVVWSKNGISIEFTRAINLDRGED